MDAKDKKGPKVVKLPDNEANSKENNAYRVLDTKFDIEKRYEIIDPIG